MEDAKVSQLNLDAGRATQNAADQTGQAAQNIKDNADKLKLERHALAAIARHLEERDARSKWDWVTLTAGMILAALLAGGGAVFFTKHSLNTANFADAIRLIQNDDDAYWCGSARAHIVQDSDGTHYCAIQMPDYVAPREGGEAAAE